MLDCSSRAAPVAVNLFYKMSKINKFYSATGTMPLGLVRTMMNALRETTCAMTTLFAKISQVPIEQDI